MPLMRSLGLLSVTLLVIFSVLSSGVAARERGNVIKLTDDNTDEQLAHGNWLLLFYAGSKHKPEEAEWTDLSVHLLENPKSGSYLVGKVDCAKYPDTCYDRKLKLKDLPKKFLLQSSDSSFTPLKGSTPTEILGAVHQVINGDVIELTQDNIDQIRDGGKWLIEFYTPWCGHCKQLAPIWKQTASEAKKKNAGFRVAKVDANAQQEIGKEFGITSYPTIKLVHGDKVFTHEGSRTVKSFFDFVANPPQPAKEVEIEYVDETGEVPVPMDKPADEL